MNLPPDPDGAVIPGGCDDCDAEQRLAEISPGIWSIAICHDDGCPAYRRICTKPMPTATWEPDVPDLHSRGGRIFGTSNGEVRWPYGLNDQTHWFDKQADPEGYEAQRDLTERQRLTIVRRTPPAAAMERATGRTTPPGGSRMANPPL